MSGGLDSGVVSSYAARELKGQGNCCIHSAMSRHLILWTGQPGTVRLMSRPILGRRFRMLEI